MMVSIMKSFAPGNVIIAQMLPYSMSLLINSKPQGCEKERMQTKSWLSKKKTEPLGQKQRTEMKAGCDIQAQTRPQITEQSWKSVLFCFFVMNYTDAFHMGSPTLCSLFQGFFFCEKGRSTGGYCFYNRKSTAFASYMERKFVFSSWQRHTYGLKMQKPWQKSHIKKQP